MRLIVDTLIALMLVAVLGLVLLHYNQQQAAIRQTQAVHAAKARIQNQIIYRGAMEEVPTTRAGFPVTIDASWFTDALPTNPAVDATHPWLDVAPLGDSADHPPDPIIEHSHQAGFWYNPTRGLIRARVPRQHTDEATVDLYNQLNSTQIPRLYVASLQELRIRQPRVVRRPDPPPQPPGPRTLAERKLAPPGTVVLNSNEPTTTNHTGQAPAAPREATARDPRNTTNRPSTTLADVPVSP